jgi:hypothetical protein
MEAKAMTVRVGNDLAGWQDPADDMGFAVNTVRKIEMASRGHFAGGCSLLFEDWLAYGAENHLKSLLDSYAHVAWILGRGGLAPPMTPSGRARCYELGMVNALREEVGLLDTLNLKLLPGATPEKGPQQAYEMLLAQHLPADGCTCDGRGRGWWNAKRTLKEMSEADAAVRADGAEWMYLLWKYAGRVEHHAGFERMLRTDGQKIWIGPAEPWQRVRTFSCLLQTYSSIVGWVAELFHADVAKGLTASLSELMGRPAIHKAWATRPSPPTSGQPKAG